MTPPLDADYVLPLRWQEDVPPSAVDELSGYLTELVRWITVTVVDGSPAPVAARLGERFPAEVRHVAPADRPGRNGKVAGVMTGLALADHERVVLADDDVRYDFAALHRIIALLDDADVVRPQNVLCPLPWHARWDTARSLINRAFSDDYPGTFAVRRSVLLPDGYDGDVLFENLEMLRTIRARGGRERRAPDLFVVRRPPSARHFLRQRVRQAYDDFAQPARLAAELCLLPLLLLLAVRRRPAAAAVGALFCVLVAETGRRRHGGRAAFPATAAWWAPLWVLERAVCVWIAVIARLRGGARYAGGRIPVAAHSLRSLGFPARPPVVTAEPAGRGDLPRTVSAALRSPLAMDAPA